MQCTATLFTICALVFGTVQILEQFTSLLHQRILNKRENVPLVFCEQREGKDCVATRLNSFLSVFKWVKTSLLESSVTPGDSGRLWMPFSGALVAMHCSHICQCRAVLAWLQSNRETTAGIRSPRCWIKSSLYPQKSRINMKNVNVCSEREKKDILKYTFIQSLCKIKQQNWSALPSALALLSPLNSPASKVSTFCSGHLQDDSSLVCCHLSSGQNPRYYGMWFVWMPWINTCLEKCMQPHLHMRNHTPLNWTLFCTTNYRLIKTMSVSQATAAILLDPLGLIQQKITFFIVSH